MILAIDGPAGVGKSTIANMISEKTGWLYINSGNFYRAITKACLESDTEIENEKSVVNKAKTINLEFKDHKLYLEGELVEDKLHTDAVDKHVAQVSAFPEIRTIVNDLLRKTTSKMNIIIEGRDITTVVFPDADFKIYFDASVVTRAKRRFDQGVSSMSFDEIKNSIKTRDEIDKNKPVGSLKIADDAEYLDTSDLTIDQVCEKVLHTIQYKE